eukprot:2888133-Rhodomonas_salina.2
MFSSVSTRPSARAVSFPLLLLLSSSSSWSALSYGACALESELSPSCSSSGLIPCALLPTPQHPTNPARALLRGWDARGSRRLAPPDLPASSPACSCPRPLLFSRMLAARERRALTSRR